MLERWANSQGFALACSVGCVKGLGETNPDTHVMAIQRDSLVRSALWSPAPLPASLALQQHLDKPPSDASPRLRILPSNWLCSQTRLLISNSRRERLDEILIPYLVIKTSWHKLSTVWGHSESSFLSPGAQSAL